MAIKIFNTLSRKKEEFVPLKPGQVKMYVCGPTVYDYLHVGNFVGAIFFNLVRSWLEKRGYKVTFVYNYTDVDDKIINRAKADGVKAEEISERFIAEFQKDFKALHLKAHSQNPKVTEFMDEIIAFIKALVDEGKAYAMNGDVYFDVTKFTEYGKLSNKNLDELMAGQRISVNEQKKHVADFALWKKAKEGEPAWQSPWGQGRPGWHIECSAMNYAIHGEQIDIHGGGLDLTFPHHENEIAQSEARTGKTFAKYWMHNNLLQFGNTKMSKSLGNIRTGRSFLEEYNGEVLKFFVLSNHYRSPIDFSQEQIERAIGNLARFYSSLCHAKLLLTGASLAPPPESFTKALESADQRFAESLDDDFNSAKAFAELYEIMRLYNSICRKPGKTTPEQQAVADAYFHWVRAKGEVMALFQEAPDVFLGSLDDMLLRKKGLDRHKIDALVEERTKVRAEKNYKRSDEIRDELVKLGVQIQDSAGGTRWEVDKTSL
jgi:cysteinyl-tRNA synthetase